MQEILHFRGTAVLPEADTWLQLTLTQQFHPEALLTAQRSDCFTLAAGACAGLAEGLLDWQALLSSSKWQLPSDHFSWNCKAG